MVSSLLLLFLLVSLLCIFVTILLSFLWTTIIGGVPYLATDKKRVAHMIDMGAIKKGEKGVDLGSGDGRIVIAMAEKGAEAHGFELNLLYVLISKINIRKNNLTDKAFIHWQNFFSVDLTKYDVITCFGIPYMMDRIEKKLQSELKPGARVVVNSFTFKHWKKSKEKDHVFLYKNPA